MSRAKRHPRRADNPAFTGRPADLPESADQAAPTTLSTAQDVPVERPLWVDTSVFDEQTWQRAQEIIARYPRSRSALLPLLHLVQSVQGHVSQAGIVFCAEQLGITTRTVDNHILKLRQKLETDPANPVHFRTVHGVGYKFVP